MTEIVPRPALSDVDPNQEVAPPVVPSGKSQSIETPPASQELPLPMLDVHPIHAPVRGWRDFFLHIATIVIGLCIAVGIQQTIEFFHSRNQLAETRQALRLEREGNYKTLAENTTAWRWGTAELQNNLLVFQYLQQHPSTPQEKLPGILLWRTSSYPFGSVVWGAVRQSGVIALMPREEIEANSNLYFLLQKVNDVQFEGARAIIDARRYDLSDADPSHLSPAQVASEIELTQAALSAHFLCGSLLLNLVQAFPDFPATVTSEELNQIHHPPDLPTTELLRAARALTTERMKAAGHGYSNPPPAQK
jgi:hypothetical protein